MSVCPDRFTITNCNLVSDFSVVQNDNQRLHLFIQGIILAVAGLVSFPLIVPSMFNEALVFFMTDLTKIDWENIRISTPLQLKFNTLLDIVNRPFLADIIMAVIGLFSSDLVLIGYTLSDAVTSFWLNTALESPYDQA